MARIYTRTGDQGETSLGDGSRISKSGGRVDLYGEIDELNSQLGCCVAVLRRTLPQAGGVLIAELEEIQVRLFDLGTVLADPQRSAQAVSAAGTDVYGAVWLEQCIDGHDAGLPALRNFILPGGGEAAAQLHLARTICRRGERRAVALAATEPLPAEALVFLNRLSDYLFTAARAANAAAGGTDVPWRSASSEDKS